MNIMIHTIILVLFFNTLGAYSETPVTSASEPLIPTNTEKTEEPGVSAPDPSSDPLTLPAEPESPATCSRLRLAREGVPVEKLISVNVGEIIKPYFQIEITNDDDSSAIGCSIDGVAIVNVIGVSTVDLKGNEAKFDNKMLATFDAISITSCLTKSSSGLGMIMLRFSAVVNGHSIHVDSQSIVPVALPQSSMIFSADAKDDSLIQADKGAPRYPIYIGQTLHPIIISILDSCGNLDVSTLDVHIDVFCTSCILDGTMSVYASRGQAIFSNIKINAIESSSPIYLMFTGSFSKKLVTIASAEFTVQQMPSESKLSTSFKVPMIISQYTLTDVLTSKLRQIICTQKCEIRISKRQRTSASNSIHATADIILYDSSNIGVETVTALLDLNKNDLSSWGLYQYSVTLGNSTDTQTELTLSTNESNLGKLSTWKWCVIVAVCSFLFVSALSWSTLICAKWRQESNQEAWDKANAHRNSEAMSSVNKLPITNKDQDCTSEPNSVKRSNKRNGTPQNKVKSERQTLNDSKPGSKEQTSNIQVKPSFHQKKGPGSTARMRFADMADLSTVNQEAKSTLNIDKKKGLATMQLSVGKKEEIAETFDDYNEDELKLYNAL